MYETSRALLDAIGLGEDSLLELKAVTFSGSKWKGPERNDLAAEIAAMANANGGLILLGVDDKTKEITGIDADNLDAAETVVRDLLNDLLEPPLIANVRKLRLPDSSGDEQALVRIDIGKSLFVHRCRGRYWVRVGSSKREMSPDYLARLMQQRSQARLIRFDEQIVPGTSSESLTKQLVDRYRTPNSDLDENLFASKLAMLAMDDGEVYRATVTGLLLGSESPQEFLPHSFIQAVAYRGAFDTAFADLENYQRDAQDLTGPLDEQVAQGCQFIKKNMTVSASKEAGRNDLPQYDLTAVFEALVNAVAHRDYSMHGSKIRLQMFADCLRLHVPGDLANSMDVDALPLRQATRNEAITSLLARTPVDASIAGLESPRTYMMDRRGEGVNLILQRSENLSGKRPTYEALEGELILTIYAANPVEPKLDDIETNESNGPDSECV